VPGPDDAAAAGEVEEEDVAAAAAGELEQEEEPLAPQQPTDLPTSHASPATARRHVNRLAASSSASNPFRMSAIGEEEQESEDDEEEVPLPEARSPMRRRRKKRSFRRTYLNMGSPFVLLTDVSGLLEQYNLTNAAVIANDDEEEDRTEDDDDEEVDAGRYRETSEQFAMRLWEEDPMEGPSWLFGDKAKRSGSASKDISSRRKKVTSNSLPVCAPEGQ
jgi:hypothetical protein